MFMKSTEGRPHFSYGRNWNYTDLYTVKTTDFFKSKERFAEGSALAQGTCQSCVNRDM